MLCLSYGGANILLECDQKMTKINKIIGIDASNIKNGGGGTHLIELLNSLDVDSLKDTKIIVWAPKLLLMKIKDYHWLDKKTHKLIR